MKMRVLIVDDEPLARRKLVRLLGDDARFQVVGEAGDGEQALQLIEELAPELVLLDIQMPRMDGFELLTALGPNRPRIIFTTAFDEYAIQAFEVRALDYLLKPFDERRFRVALDRAFQERSMSHDPRLDDLLEELRSRRSVLRRIPVRQDGRVIFLDASQVTRISAEDKYVRLHFEGRSILHRETLQNLEKRLDPSTFVRVHRSQVVNMEFVKELALLSHGDYEIVMRDESRVPLGRTYRAQFTTRFTYPPGV